MELRGYVILLFGKGFYMKPFVYLRIGLNIVSECISDLICEEFFSC